MTTYALDDDTKSPEFGRGWKAFRYNSTRANGSKLSEI